MRGRTIGTVTAALTSALVVTATLAGCTGSNDDLVSQYRSGDTKNYISGDGAVTEYPAHDRGEPVAFTARDLDGDVVRAADLRGRPVVLNFWYATCGPCRLEAADLTAVSDAHRGTATFLGVDVRDEAGTARAFVEQHDVPYRTVVDRDATVQLAFSGRNAPNSTPSTIVLDAQGRVSARILGPVNRSVLTTLVDEAGA